ncbi:MAG: cupin domain-containing protein [Methylobacteriaceae bacterium]|nr:cupin domain-containing protein [Methylobacteriaceae bacterium]
MREHIDFIQAQMLPWDEGAGFGLSGTRVKLLSRDDATGAISLILRLPAGWSRAAGALARDEEIYVLDGALDLAGRRLRRHTYSFLPGGHIDNALASEAGATLLYFRSEPAPTELLTREAVAARLVPPVDLAEGSWDGDFDRFGLGSMKDGARMRVLRQDPFSGETTYITATIAFRRGVRAERHPISQEFFLLSGELAGDRGTMQAGAYCIRPPMAKHAPYGSPTGALILFRGFGGRQETYWEDADPFTFFPEHRPILPERLRPLGLPAPPQSLY